MINITLSQIVAAVQSKTIEKLESLVPPGAYRFICARLTAAVLTEYARFTKQQREAVQRYGYLEEGGTINVMNPKNAPENIVAFNDAMNELLALDIALDFEPILFSRLGKAAQETLTVGDLRLLGPLVSEG